MSDGINSVYCFVEKDTKNSRGHLVPGLSAGGVEPATGRTLSLLVHKLPKEDKFFRLPGVRPAGICTWADQGPKTSKNNLPAPY